MRVHRHIGNRRILALEGFSGVTVDITVDLKSYSRRHDQNHTQSVSSEHGNMLYLRLVSKIGVVWLRLTIEKKAINVLAFNGCRLYGQRSQVVESTIIGNAHLSHVAYPS